jgi:hypothetical protein
MDMQLEKSLAHLDLQNPVGLDLMKDQLKTLGDGGRSRNEIIPALEGLPAPSMNRKNTLLIKIFLLLLHDVLTPIHGQFISQNL